MKGSFNRLKNMLVRRKVKEPAQESKPTVEPLTALVIKKSSAVGSPGSSPLTPMSLTSNSSTDVSTSNTSISATASTPASTEMMLSLKNSEVYKLFGEFMKREFRYELLLIWDNIQAYRQTEGNEKKGNVARFIHNTFLKACDDSSRKIVKEEVEKVFNSSSPVFDNSLFDSLEKQVEPKLSDLYLKFTRTEEFVYYKQRGTSPVTRSSPSEVSASKMRPQLTRLTLGFESSAVDKRIVSPTVGESPRFVGSPRTSPSVDKLSIVASPRSIASPGLSSVPRFVGSPMPISPEVNNNTRSPFSESTVVALKKQRNL